jgi:hypothetical protein
LDARAIWISALSSLAAACGRFDFQELPCNAGGPSCAAGTRCSAIGACIPEAECRSDEDCRAAERCAAGSLVCMPRGECLADEDCPLASTCGERALCVGCGGSSIDLLTGTVMIVLDRTASMSEPLGASTRWEVAKAAIDRITNAFAGRIRFGLVTYSACLPGGCSAGSVVVPLGEDPAAINDFLDPLRGIGSPTGTAPNYLCESEMPETSTGATLAALVGLNDLQDPARNSAVILLTDGAMSADCVPPTGPEGAAALLAQPIAVRTFAIGVGLDADMDQLEAIADAGGTERAFRAEDEVAFDRALDEIAADVTSCVYGLADLPDELGLVHVFADGAEIAPDDTNGYAIDEGALQLRLRGEACALLRSGAVETLEIVFACADP